MFRIVDRDWSGAPSRGCMVAALGVVLLTGSARAGSHPADAVSAPPRIAAQAPPPPTTPEVDPVVPPPQSPTAATGDASTGHCDIRVRSYDRTRPPDSKVEPGPAVIAGALVLTRVDVELDAARLSAALKALGRAARVNVLALYRTRSDGAGLDGTAPVTLSLENVTAQEALEAILAAATGMVDSTWQIRGNLVECGPKLMLAEASRRETRVYDIADVRFEAPYYAPSGPADPNADRHRRLPKEISADFARLIMNNVEPDAWREPDPQPGAAPTPSSNLDGEGRNEIFVRGQWASLHLKGDTLLVVNAPDFIHRQIGGMGKLVPPVAASELPDTTAPEAPAKSARPPSSRPPSAR